MVRFCEIGIVDRINKIVGTLCIDDNNLTRVVNSGIGPIIIISITFLFPFGPDRVRSVLYMVGHNNNDTDMSTTFPSFPSNQVNGSSV